jgi:hypothetical protein
MLTLVFGLMGAIAFFVWRVIAREEKARRAAENRALETPKAP